MEEKIVSLKQQGLTLKQIAAELDVPIGKVQYAWRKWRNQQQEVEEVVPVKQKSNKKAKAKAKAKAPGSTSRKQVATAKETSDVNVSPLLAKGPEGYWQLPDRYNVDFLHAVVQSPNSVYVCWEVSDLVKETLELQFMRRWEELPKAFRILDVTLLDYASGHANRSYTFDLP